MVTIVGAGPAGATAARTLAKAGVPVRLLDRSRFPRNKPCGGGISLRVLKRFPYLEPELGRIATHTVSRLHLEGPGGASTVVDAAEPAALMIRRVEFDALLVALAVEAGAELVTGVEVVQAEARESSVALTARDGRRFESPTVIAADGVHSVVARRLGINPGWPASRLALDMMEETPRSELRDVDPSALWVAYGFDPSTSQRPGGTRRGHEPAAGCGRVPEGYAYVFPKRDHVNVGIGYVLDHFRSAIDRRPYDLQRRFVSYLRDRGVLDGESVEGNFTPFLIPVGGPLRQPGRGRVLLAGDAGGFVNGFTAEGIYYAMVSGDLSARAVLSTPPRAHAALARNYQRACDEEVGVELRDSVIIQQYLFGNPHRIRNVIDGAEREQKLTRLLLDFAIGKVSYRTLRRRLVLRVPMLALRFAWARLSA
jgi:geranylgeranyl reductase family protein